MGFLRDCKACFLLGFTGEYNGYTLEDYYSLSDEEKEPVKPIQAAPAPHYIIQQVESLTDQIETNNAILYQFDLELPNIYNQQKQLALEKKRHKLAYDTAKLEEKRYKLIEKYKLEE